MITFDSHLKSLSVRLLFTNIQDKDMKKLLPFSSQLEGKSIVSGRAKYHYFTEIWFWTPPPKFTCLALVKRDSLVSVMATKYAESLIYPIKHFIIIKQMAAPNSCKY